MIKSLKRARSFYSAQSRDFSVVYHEGFYTGRAWQETRLDGVLITETQTHNLTIKSLRCYQLN